MRYIIHYYQTNERILYFIERPASCMNNYEIDIPTQKIIP